MNNLNNGLSEFSGNNVIDDLTVIPTVVYLQTLAYYLAVARNCDVDKPRNLAKSVTVE